MTTIQNIEQRLNQLRATLAQTERWSAPWMVAWLAEAHLSGELGRLKSGLTSCGCDFCRESRATAQATLRVTKAAKPGRPPMPLDIGKLRELCQDGLGIKRIAELMGVSHMTISWRLVALSLGQSSEGAGVAQHSTALCSREPS